MKTRVWLFLHIFSFFLLPRATGQQARPNEYGPWQFLQVNTWTGNLLCRRSDLFIPTRGEIPLDISFSYNSLKCNQDRGYGKGWSFSFGMWYSVTGNLVTIGREEGEEDVFTYSGGVYLPPVGIYDQLTEYASGKFLLITKYGVKYYFEDSSHKKLTKITDRNGNNIIISYSGGFPATITDPSGRVLNLNWTNGHLIKITDPNMSPARQIDFQYDASWNNTKVTRPLNNTYQYGYDSQGYMTSVTDPRSTLVTVVYDTNKAVAGISCQSAGYQKSFMYDVCNSTTTVSQIVSTINRQTIYTFDLSGRVLSKKFPDNSIVSWTWDMQDNMTSFINETGNITTWTYDSRGNLLTATDCMGNTETYTYDATYNFVIGHTDKNGAPVSYVYDGIGNLTSITDCYSKTTTYVYDSYGQMLASTGKNGFTTTYTHDAYGNQTGLTDPLGFTESATFDMTGNMISSTNKIGSTTTYTYDLLGRQTGYTDALGYTISLSYDGNDNLITVIDQNSNEYKYSYDPINRLIRKQGDSKKGNAAPSAILASYTYDEAGNMISETNANGCVTTFIYNSRDWKTGMTDPRGNSESYSYNQAGKMISMTDKGGNTSNFSYNCLGQMNSASDPMGYTESWGYDPMGHPTSHTDKNGISTTSVYDCLGRLSATNYPMGYSEISMYDFEGNKTGFTDRNGNVTTYGYDAIGRLISATDPLSFTETRVLDGEGNPIAFTDKNGNTTLIAYDALGRMVATTDPLGFTENYFYDGNGNKLTVIDKRGNSTSFTYDGLNRNTSLTDPMGFSEYHGYDLQGNMTTFTDKNGKTTTHVFDCINMKTSTTDPLGYTEYYTYSPEGHLVMYKDKKGNATTSTYNCCRNTATTDPLGFTEYYGYDPYGDIINYTDKNGKVTLFGYDQLHRRNSTTTPMGNLSQSTYDGVGNILSQTDANTSTTQYTYNARNELINIQNPDASTVTYTYDSNGNLLTSSNTGGVGEIVTNTYDVMDRLLSKMTNYGGFSKTVSYMYDPNGNTTSIASEAGSINNFFDANNRLIQTTDQNGQVTTFTYDSAGNQTGIHYPNGINTHTSYDPMHRPTHVTTSNAAKNTIARNIPSQGEKKITDQTTYLIDCSVVELISPVSGPDLTDNEYITVLLMNYGIDPPLDVIVSYSVDGGMVVTEFVSQPLFPMMPVVYTFMQPADLSIPDHYYEIFTCVNAFGDEDPSNDCLVSVIYHMPEPEIVFQSYFFEYDENGNKTYEQHEDGKTITFGYNLRNELISEYTVPPGDLNQYTFTPTGHRATETKNGISKPYTYNDDDVLTGAGSVMYIPDNNGNRLTMIDQLDTTFYAYGNNQELKQVIFPDHSTATYDHASSGALLRKTENGIFTYMLSDGRNLLGEFDGSGMLTCSYNPGISIDQGGMTGFYYQDGYGSNTLLADPFGVVLAIADFDESGNITNSSGTWMNNRMIFANMVYNQATQIYALDFLDILSEISFDPSTGQPLQPNFWKNPEATGGIDFNKQVKFEDLPPDVQQWFCKGAGIYFKYFFTGSLASFLNAIWEWLRDAPPSIKMKCPVGKTFKANIPLPPGIPLPPLQPMSPLGPKQPVQKGNPVQSKADSTLRANLLSSAEKMCHDMGATICVGHCQICGAPCQFCRGELTPASRDWINKLKCKSTSGKRAIDLPKGVDHIVVQCRCTCDK